MTATWSARCLRTGATAAAARGTACPTIPGTAGWPIRPARMARARSSSARNRRRSLSVTRAARSWPPGPAASPALHAGLVPPGGLPAVTHAAVTGRCYFPSAGPGPQPAGRRSRCPRPASACEEADQVRGSATGSLSTSKVGGRDRRAAAPGHRADHQQDQGGDRRQADPAAGMINTTFKAEVLPRICHRYPPTAAHSAVEPYSSAKAADPPVPPPPPANPENPPVRT